MLRSNQYEEGANQLEQECHQLEGGHQLDQECNQVE